MVELRGFGPLTFCMPCSMIQSEDVALGPVPAGQAGFGVWGRLARSGVAWGRCHLICHLPPGPPSQGRSNHGDTDQRLPADSGDRQP